MAFYTVRNWDQFQHYKDRNPPWIKLHFALLSSEDWVMWDDASRVLAIACMLIASRNEGKVDGSERGLAYLQRVAYLNKKPNLKPLIECGFLECASGSLADASEMLADASSSVSVSVSPSVSSSVSEEINSRARVDRYVELPDGLSPQVWADYQAYRKRIRHPLNETTTKRVFRELEKAKLEGFQPDDALAEAMDAGWRGLKVEWLKERAAKTAKQGASPQKPSLYDVTMENAKRAKAELFGIREGKVYDAG
jgi:hypothetical protein